MLTQDVYGRFWNPGLRLGIVYGIIAGVLYAVLDYTLHNSETPERWLPMIAGFLILAPIAAASHAYAVGQRSQIKAQREENAS